MADYQDELERLMATLGDLKPPALFDRVEEIARLCQAHGDPDEAAAWWIDLIQLASHHAHFRRELAAFDALRRLRDAQPEDERLTGSVLWYYKWIAERLSEFAEVGREQIDGFFAAMERDYDAAGAGKAAVHQLRCRAAGSMGDRDEAARQFAHWQETETSDADDCPACQTHATVLHHLAMEEVDAALDAARPVLEEGQSCEEVPAVTFSVLLLPMAFSRGDVRLAEAMRRFTRRQVRKSPNLATYLANHVVYLVFTGRTSEAARLLPSLLRTADATDNTAIRFAGFSAAWAALVRLAAEDVQRLPLPPGLSLTGDARSAPVSEAIVWAANHAAAAAEALDARNGNTQRADRLASLHAAIRAIPTPDAEDG